MTKNTSLSLDKTEILSLLPGPVSVPERILRAMAADLDAGHTEDEHLELYRAVTDKLALLLNTRSELALMSGEGMLALWAALKSCLQVGDTLLCLDTGYFGEGFAQMGKALGCRVESMGFAYDGTINQAGNMDRIESAIKRCKPKMIVAVHCETPSGTINPLSGLGEMKKRLQVPLLCADMVSSVGGMEIKADEWQVDLALGGSQKCLSAPPSMCFASVSERAWEEIERVRYPGYDSLLSFRHARGKGIFPYTPYRQGTAALNAGLDLLLEEGLPQVFARHERVAGEARRGLERLGFKLFPQPSALPSPTVTAAYVPEKYAWPEWNAGLKEKGLFVGENFGPLEGRVFRLGHMGAQAQSLLVEKALGVLAQMV
jgi:aspartate aminotransferase-like enzyme